MPRIPHSSRQRSRSWSRQMAEPRRVRRTETERKVIDGRTVSYQVVLSRTARALRLRVGPNGVEVARPVDRTKQDVDAFLDRHGTWILSELRRVDQLRHVRRSPTPASHLLFRGVATPVRIETVDTRSRGAIVLHDGAQVVVRRGSDAQTTVERSLERWLRRQARTAILAELARITPRLGQAPNRVYVMGQRTKWGNCSSRQNLSFNWRLVLAPEFVLQYLVTHEAVHLAVPDHSAKFWLTVQSICPQSERARQWLAGRGDELREQVLASFE
jgi:predicted metal-dependent hydrolase